jgi:hypothetical protein
MPARQDIAFSVNGSQVGSEAFALRASEAIARTVVLDAPRKLPVETVTASASGRLFAVQAELATPPDMSAGRRFTGETMLAGGGLGKLDQLTLSLWTQTAGLHEPWTALLNTAGWEPGGFHVQYLEAGDLQASVYGAQPDDNVGSASTPGRAQGWRLITVTYDTSARRAAMFINGKPDGQLEIANAVPVYLDAFTIGGWTSGGRRFTGRMADVRLYDRVLNPIEIRSLLEGKSSAEGLVAAWDFSQPSGKTVPDTTGHGHDLIEAR